VERIPVTGSRIQKTEAEEVSEIEISAEEAQLVAPSGDVAQVPKLFPGTLARPQDSEVAIRGSNARESLYYVDDLQAPILFEPISGTSVIPTKAIDKLSFYPGNFASEYGNSTGGVIKLHTRDATIIEPYSEFRFNMPIYLSGYHEQDLSTNSSMIASVRQSTLEPFVDAFVHEEGLVLLPYFRDAYLQYYYGDDQFSIKPRYIYSQSGAEVKALTDRPTESEGTAEFNFKNGYNLVGVDFTTRLGDVNLELDPYYSISHTEFTTDDIFFDIDVNTLTLPLRSQIRLNNQVNVFLGMEVIHRNFNLSALVPDTLNQGGFADPENAPRIRLSADGHQREDAVWGSLELGLGKFLLTPGLRAYQQTNIDRNGIDPRLVGRYWLNSRHTLKFGAGRYSASPLPQELDESFGNPELTWIESNHYTVGWEALVLDSWTSDLQLFYKSWQNIPLADPAERFVSETTRQSKGLEWFFRYDNADGLFGWLSYTYSETKEIRGEDSKEIFSDNDATHILHLVANYMLTDTFQLTARFKHQTGYVYTPVDKVWYQANTGTYRPEENPDLINSARVPDTTTLSFFAQKDIKYPTWTLITRFGLEEYQFRKSSPNIVYNYDYSEKDYTTGLPVIPFIELRAIL
jgi:hypothetical protein